MKQISELNFDEFVTVVDNRIVTNSHKVAKEFGKSRAHVLRDLRTLEANCPVDWFKSNFGFRFEISELQNGKPIKVCDMSKDGFMLLVMGFTGKKALAKKLEFIAAFNAMATFLANQEKNLWQKMQALIAQEVESKVRASFGSHLMLERKREIPHFREERELLETQIQPSLLLPH